MSLSTHIGVAVVLPCAVGVFMCSVACSSSDQWPQSTFLSYCRSAADLSDISYPTPAALHLCFPGRQNCNRATLHTALYCELCSLHTRHRSCIVNRQIGVQHTKNVIVLHYVHVHCSRTLYWCLEFDVVEQSPHIHHRHLIHRTFVAVSFRLTCETWAFRLTNRMRMAQW